MNLDPLLAAVDCLDYPRSLLLDRYLACHLYRLESQFRTAAQPVQGPRAPADLERAAATFDRQWEGDL